MPEPFDRNRALRRLRAMRDQLKFDPRAAGVVCQLEAVLELDGWPFNEEQYRNLCLRLLGYVPGEVRRG